MEGIGGGEFDFIAISAANGRFLTNSGVVNNLMMLRTSGIGALLEVNGSVKLTFGTGASMTYSDGMVQSTAWSGVLSGGDYAESVDVIGERTQYQLGDLLEIDARHPDKFLKVSKAYSQLVAVVSAFEREHGRKRGATLIQKASSIMGATASLAVARDIR